MTLAWVVPGPLDRRSGGYSYDVDAVAALEALGHRVVVWSLPSRGAARVLREHLAEQPDAVVFDALVHPALAGDLPRLRTASRALWIGLVHHLAWLEDPKTGPRTARKKRTERRFLETMDAFWFNSDDTRATVAALRGPGAAGKPSVVCRPPVPAPATPASLPSGQGRLFFLANLLPRKNLAPLIEALGRLAQRRPDLGWTLTIAGSPSLAPAYARRCRRLAEGWGLGARIHWEGRVDDGRRDQLWRECDVFVLPSSHEGWGMAHAEALVRGLPVIAVPRGGSLEVLGDAALWTEPTAGALETALERILTEPALRLDLARRARHRKGALEARTGFAALGPFLADLGRWKTPSPPSFSFPAYLEAKASVDERALHPRVAQAAWEGSPPRKVWELGGGTGTMARRLLTQGRIGPGTRYLLVDQDPALLDIAQERCAPLFEPGEFRTWRSDLLAFWESPPSPGPDLVVAHALLDLFDPDAAARALGRLGARRFWLTHLFDGLTSWEPSVDPDLDRSLAEAYHRSMADRAPGGAQGSPRSGRDWLAALPRAGFEVLDAASSDWLVRSIRGTYPENERVFLESMLHFFRTSLTGRPDVDQAGLAWWLAVRQGQIARGEASLVVHQLDLVAGLTRGN